MRPSALESKTTSAYVNKMDKQRLRATLKVSEAVKERFPDTKQFIEDLIDEECQKEKIFANDVIFFFKSRSKELAQKNIFYFCSE